MIYKPNSYTVRYMPNINGKHICKGYYKNYKNELTRATFAFGFKNDNFEELKICNVSKNVFDSFDYYVGSNQIVHIDYEWNDEYQRYIQKQTVSITTDINTHISDTDLYKMINKLVLEPPTHLSSNNDEKHWVLISREEYWHIVQKNKSDWEWSK